MNEHEYSFFLQSVEQEHIFREIWNTNEREHHLFENIEHERTGISLVYFHPWLQVLNTILLSFDVKNSARKLRPREGRVRLVWLVSHWEVRGEKSGESTIEYSLNNL